MPGEIFQAVLKRIQDKDASLPDRLDLTQQAMRQTDLNELTTAIDAFPEYKARLRSIILDSSIYFDSTDDVDDSQKNKFVSIYLDNYALLDCVSIKNTNTASLEMRDCPQARVVYIVGNPSLYRKPGGYEINHVTKVNCPKLLWRGFRNPAFAPTLIPSLVPGEKLSTIDEANKTRTSPLPFAYTDSDDDLGKLDSDDDWFPDALVWDFDDKPRAYTLVRSASTTVATGSEPSTPGSSRTAPSPGTPTVNTFRQRKDAIVGPSPGSRSHRATLS